MIQTVMSISSDSHVASELLEQIMSTISALDCYLPNDIKLDSPVNIDLYPALNRLKRKERKMSQTASSNTPHTI